MTRPVPDGPATPGIARRVLPLPLVDALLLAGLVALPLAWFFDPLRITWGPIHTRMSWSWKAWILPVVFLALRALLRRRGFAGGLFRAAAIRKATASWLITWGFFMAIEGALALAGLHPAAAPPIVIHGNESVDTRVYDRDPKVVHDPELLWRFAPGRRWDGITINQLGFRDREFTAEKPVGMRRVIAMGDSCTAQGHPPYSGELDRLFQAQPPTPARWEAVNTGVFGYSSLQGLRQFQNTVRHFSPDVVTLYFGWNDHWIHDRPDDLRLARRLHPAHAAVVDSLQRLRLFGVLSRVMNPPAHAPRADDRKTYRVPPGLYEATLARFVEEIQAIGALPVLITAPRRALTQTLVNSGHARSPEEAQRVHDEYVGITRAVAAARGVPLLDLAAAMAGPEYDAMFSRDGIHFRQSGLAHIAGRIHAKLLELSASGQWD